MSKVGGRQPTGSKLQAHLAGELGRGFFTLFAKSRVDLVVAGTAARRRMGLVDQLTKSIGAARNCFSDILPRDALAQAELAWAHQAREIHRRRGYNGQGSAASNFGEKQDKAKKKWLPNRYDPIFVVILAATKRGLTKTTFKAHALEHLRNVQANKRPLIILDRGKPVLKVIPYAEDMDAELGKFRNLLIRYDDPTAPVGLADWQLV